jgi:hypothetical protein
VKGLYGSEKAGFLEDEEIRRLLALRYGLVVDAGKAGSIEMVRSTPAGELDFLWPSSQVALELYRIQRDNASVKSDLIFSSPLVVYSWEPVIAALEKAGVAARREGVWEITDFPQLVKWIEGGKKWSEIGLSQLYGRVSVISTDPQKSNSGLLFAGLLGSILAGGDTVDAASLPPLLPRISAVFSRLGYMEHSTGILFEQYLKTGMGSYPLIIGYENLIIEFSLQNPDLWPRVKDTLRIAYPVPTIWSAHPLIALTPKGGRLMEALKDKDIQRLAWERHGFRTGLVGVTNDPKVVKIAGIPETVSKVIAAPSPQVMDRILSAIQGAASQ